MIPSKHGKTPTTDPKKLLRISEEIKTLQKTVAFLALTTLDRRLAGWCVFTAMRDNLKNNDEEKYDIPVLDAFEEWVRGVGTAESVAENIVKIHRGCEPSYLSSRISHFIWNQSASFNAVTAVLILHRGTSLLENAIMSFPDLEGIESRYPYREYTVSALWGFYELTQERAMGTNSRFFDKYRRAQLFTDADAKQWMTAVR